MESKFENKNIILLRNTDLQYYFIPIFKHSDVSRGRHKKKGSGNPRGHISQIRSHTQQIWKRWWHEPTTQEISEHISARCLKILRKTIFFIWIKTVFTKERKWFFFLENRTYSVFNIFPSFMIDNHTQLEILVTPASMLYDQIQFNLQLSIEILEDRWRCKISTWTKVTSLRIGSLV